MKNITNEELIEKAKSVTKPKKISGDFTIGDVGCALVTEENNINICMLCMPMVMHKNPSDKSIYHWDFYALLGF